MMHAWFHSYRRDRKTVPSRLAIITAAVLSLASLHVTNACAVSLGPIQASSKLGEPFRGVLTVDVGRTDASHPVSLRMADPDAYRSLGLPYSSAAATISVKRRLKGSSAVIELSSIDAIEDPAFALVLEAVSEDGVVRRQYLIMLDMPVASASKASEAVHTLQIGEGGNSFPERIGKNNRTTDFRAMVNDEVSITREPLEQHRKNAAHGFATRVSLIGGVTELGRRPQKIARISSGRRTQSLSQAVEEIVPDGWLVKEVGRTRRGSVEVTWAAHRTRWTKVLGTVMVDNGMRVKINWRKKQVEFRAISQLTPVLRKSKH